MTERRRVLHRHQRLHRLQGLRGRLQGMEPRARGRGRLDGRVLRQHARAGREHVAPRRVRRAGGADPDHGRRADARAGRRRGRGRGLPLADGARTCASTAPTPRASTCARPARSSDRVRHRRRPAGRLQRLRLLRPGLPVRRASTGARTTAARGSARSATTATKDGLEPACAKACPTDSIQFGPLDELRERADARLAKLQDEGWNGAQLYGRDPDGPVGGIGAFFLLLDEPEDVRAAAGSGRSDDAPRRVVDGGVRCGRRARGSNGARVRGRGEKD